MAKKKIGTLPVQGEETEDGMAETGMETVEAPEMCMTEAVAEALKGSQSTPPTLFDVKDGPTVRWYLIDVDGPSVERAWEAYRSYRPVPNPMEFLTCLGAAAGNMGRTFGLVSRVSL